MVVFLMNLKMFGQIGNPFCNQGDLDLGTTRVFVVLSEPLGYVKPFSLGK
jgi:hypothetical protein